MLGGLLLGAGILIAGASGLCSTAYVVIGLVSLLYAPSVGEAAATAFFGLMLLLFVGGIPFGIGMGLIMTGRRLQREDTSVDAGDLE